jgi:hypothetical protein
MKKIMVAILILFTASYNVKSTTYSSNSGTNKTNIAALYKECGLQDMISLKTFEKAMDGYNKYCHAKNIIAICDFTKPSTHERFFIIDMDQKKVLVHSLVAHGKNSGDLMATKFSNVNGSLQSSLGFFSIGNSITVAKHGLSLVLNGLEPGINDNAYTRGIIIHGAFYVTADFVKKYGVLGKSWGCPALPDAIIPQVVNILQNGALLYIGAA